MVEVSTLFPKETEKSVSSAHSSLGVSLKSDSLGAHVKGALCLLWYGTGYHWNTVGMAFALKSLKDWSLKMASTIPRNPHRMLVLCRHLAPVPSALFWPWRWGRREQQRDQDKHCVLERTEDNGTLLPGELGKMPALERDLGAWLCGCLFKRKISKNSTAGRWSRPRKCPFCSGMRKGSGLLQDPDDLAHAHKAQRWLKKVWIHIMEGVGIGPGCSAMKARVTLRFVLWLSPRETF